MNPHPALQISVMHTCNKSSGYGCLSISVPKGLFQKLIILANFYLFGLTFFMFIQSQGVKLIRKLEQNQLCNF